ncbi:MAG: QueT transporter family protein [Clostridium sp.]
MRENKKTVYFLVYGAAIAAIYVVLTMVFAPISFGPVQFRIAEALCILPFFTPAAVPGLFIGCLLSNLLCGAAPLDIVFGSLATLIGAVGSYAVRKNRWLVCIPPIVANTVLIPWVLRYAYGSEAMIYFAMVTVGIGEILAIGILGNVLLTALERYKKFIFGRCPGICKKV